MSLSKQNKGIIDDQLSSQRGLANTLDDLGAAFCETGNKTAGNKLISYAHQLRSTNKHITEAIDQQITDDFRADQHAFYSTIEAVNKS